MIQSYCNIYTLNKFLYVTIIFHLHANASSLNNECHTCTEVNTFSHVKLSIQITIYNPPYLCDTLLQNVIQVHFIQGRFCTRRDAALDTDFHECKEMFMHLDI